jgi:chromosome segregation ATPase
MTDPESQLEEVKAQIQDVQRQIARAEYENDTARRARNEALANLQALGAESEEDANRLLSSLKDALAAELRTVQEELAVGE